MQLSEFQDLMDRLYGPQDRERGIPSTVAWLCEEVGELAQAVRKGQVVCIVEAMKLMNEIEAEADGKVAEILVKNGEHVEYGQALIRLTPA